MSKFVTTYVCAAVLFGFAFVSGMRAQNANNDQKQSRPGVVVLRCLLLGESEAAAGLMMPPTDGRKLVVAGVPLLDTPEFAALIEPFYGQPINDQLANAIGQAIGAYAKQHDRIVIDVLIPKQNASDGTLRLGVAIGKYKNLTFMGNRWFSGTLLQNKMGIKPGDEVRLSTLEEAVNWANTNPYRRVKVLINDLPKEPGKADLMVAVQEKFPLKLAASYDNTGSEVLGTNHYTGSVQYGNLWGLDHQISYAYTSTDYRKLYQVHSLDYRLPLPWRHSIQLNAAYADVRPTFGGGWFVQKGESIIANARYIMAKEKGIWSTEYAFGAEFKQSNNNLEFGGFQLGATKNDIFQGTFSATIGRRDDVGAWVFGLNANASPGNLNSRNTDENYQATRVNSKARFLDATLQLQRLTNLPAGFDLYSRMQLQLASTNLLGSEQLTIGGQGTVRGYRERIISGDEGYVFSQELQGPTWSLTLPKTSTAAAPLQLRLLAFWDYARVYYNGRIISDIPLDALMSAGLGLRANLSYYFSLTADYGWQIKDTWHPQPDRARGHIRVSLAY